VVAPGNYAPGMEADLVILDGFVPPAAQMPKADTLLIRPVVTGAGDVGGFKVTQEIENPAILRWKREDPVMQYVELGELQVYKALFLEREPELIELVSAPESPLIAYKDFGGTVGGVRRYFVTFSPLVDSNWWRQNSLLIFLPNIVAQTRVRHSIGMPQLLTTGTAAKLWNVGEEAAGTGSVTVVTPEGSKETLEAKDGAAEFEKTEKVGFYEVTAGKKKSSFAVNLLNSTESDIRPRSLQTAAGSNVEETASVASVNKEVWHWLAIAALVVLVAEWWVYHRRIA
jgi:hypothetical protein